MKKNQLKNYFKQNNWYLSKDRLNKLGFSRNSIIDLIEKNKIIKISNSLYRWTETDLGGIDDYSDISHIEPKGVFCLYTALNYYDLTTFISNKYYLAIPKSCWVREGLKQFPIVVKRWEQKYYELGIDLVNFGGFPVRMYNIEKTICDCMRNLKEVGLNTLKEVLSTYLQSKKKNISKLNLYGKALGIYKPLNEYARMLS
jgi:predicted transcriptional regulator of viral defense system